jgi:hypothetical protein
MEEMGELLRDAANTACGGTPKPPGRFYRKGAKVAKNRGGGFFETMMSFATPSRPLRLCGSLFDEEKTG